MDLPTDTTPAALLSALMKNPELFIGLFALLVMGSAGKASAATRRVLRRPPPDLPPQPVPPLGGPVWPVPAGKWSTKRRHQYGYDRGSHRHNGIDVFAPIGSSVLTPLDGVVTVVHNAWAPGFSGYGKCVVVKTELNGEPLWWLFSHLDRIDNLRVGDTVRAGTRVGFIGTTRFDRKDKLSHFKNSKPHTHIEVTPVPWRFNAARVDPSPILRSLSPA